MKNERGNTAGKRVVIKKYENRRLYDSTNSRYVNLDEVAQMVQSGYDVQVVDAATGEDLTRLILTQIVVEQAKAPDSTFPLDVLRQMVVASGRATQESTLKYMKAMFDMYQGAFRAMAPPISPFEFIPRPATPPAAPTPEPQWKVGVAEPVNETAQVGALKRRLEELENRMTKLGRNKKPRKPAGKQRRRT